MSSASVVLVVQNELDADMLYTKDQKDQFSGSGDVTAAEHS